MLFYTVLCVYILAPRIEINGEHSSEEKPEPIFVDVIKNITRVNHELQVLIKKYKQIKKKRYFQDDFEVKENLEEKTKLTDKNSTTPSYPTEMIFVEEEAEKTSGSEKSNEGENHSRAEPSNEEEKSHEAESEKSKENQPKSHETEKLKTGKKELKVNKSITKGNETEDPTDSKLLGEASIDSIRPKIDTLQEKSSKEKPTHPIDPTHSKEKSKDPKRFKKEPTRPSRDKEKAIDPKHSKEETEENKRIMPEVLGLEEVEVVSKKTRYSVKKTPIKDFDRNSSQLPIKHVSIGSDDDDDTSKLTEQSNEATTAKFTVGIYLRSINGSNLTKKPDIEPLAMMSDNEALSREFIKASALRLAYGDACLKLVIRKCHKACKSVIKSSCRVVRCKSDFKDFYQNTARTRCIEQFDAGSKNVSVVGLRRIDRTARAKSRMKTEDLAPACLMRIAEPKKGMSLNTTLDKNSNQSKNEGLNILRDKYEKACRKTSIQKCKTACLDTGNETCDHFECKKKLKKRFKRNCKTQCKKVFSSHDTKSSSDSDSDYSSDSYDYSGSDTSEYSTDND